jgi:ubiquitin-conjugating enzyme E2 J1
MSVVNSIPSMELNYRCAGVKRLMKEAAELSEPTDLFCAQPLEDNLFEWHFTVRGPPDTEFEEGVYHGRIILPTEYPMKPPNLVLLTPNGRFETNKKVCLSISGYHPETWLPSWSIRTALLALIGFMPSAAAGAVGAIECSAEERKKLAKKSLDWRCDTCGCSMREVLDSFQRSTNSAEESLRDMNAAIKANQAEAASNTSNPPAVAEPITSTPPRSSSPAEVSPPRSSRRTVTQTEANAMSTGFVDILRSPGFWLIIFSGILFGLILRRVVM